MKEAKEEYSPLQQRSKLHQRSFEKLQVSFVDQTLDIVSKAKCSIRLFSESLTNDLSCKDSVLTDLSGSVRTSELC
jgi:hypothetical protein